VLPVGTGTGTTDLTDLFILARNNRIPVRIHRGGNPSNQKDGTRIPDWTYRIFGRIPVPDTANFSSLNSLQTIKCFIKVLKKEPYVPDSLFVHVMFCKPFKF
jgi:hypothetical protein